jgi:hypothetical protein
MTLRHRCVVWCAVLWAMIALGGCFSPDYGEGNFACTKGECPEGYQCVTAGQQKVCRKIGWQNDAGQPKEGGSVDHPVIDTRHNDGPALDVPGKDIPLTDGPQEGVKKDVLASEGPLADLPLADTPLFDHPILPEATLVDSVVPPADHHVADGFVPLPDQFIPVLDLHLPTPDVPTLDHFIPVPDLPPPTPDIFIPTDVYPHPTCGKPEIVAGDVLKVPQSFDLTLTSVGEPSFAVLSSTNSLYWAHSTPTGWGVVSIRGDSGTQVAMANAYIDGNDHQHVLYRKVDTSGKVLAVHSYQILNQTKWSMPQGIGNWNDITSLDIGAFNEYVYVDVAGSVLYGGTPPMLGPIYNMWQLVWDSAGSKYGYSGLGNVQGETFLDTRVGVGPDIKGWGVYATSGLNLHWLLGIMPHKSSWNSAGINAPGTIPSSCGVAIDGLNNTHLVYVRANPSTKLGSLNYGFIAKGSTTPNETVLITKDEIQHQSVDIALDSNDYPIITYLNDQGELRMFHRVGKNWVNYLLLNKVSGVSTRVSSYKGEVHIGFDHMEKANDLYYLTCKLP